MSEPAEKKSGWSAAYLRPLAEAMLPFAEKDPVKRMEMQRQVRIDIWRRETSYGSWLVWPVWAVGWCVGLVVSVIRGLWWNVTAGYKRWTTHWTDGWDDAD